MMTRYEVCRAAGAELRAYRIGRPLQQARVHAGEILAEDAQRDQLRSGKDDDDRGEKNEARDPRALDKKADDDESEQEDAEEGDSEAQSARPLKRRGAEAGHHV